jgi:hypothetical protein
MMQANKHTLLISLLKFARNGSHPQGESSAASDARCGLNKAPGELLNAIN